jgi:membrane associated rhomboid family serine protease
MAPVGVHCPECVREARQSASGSRPLTTRVARAFGPGSQRPVVTYILIAASIIGFVLEVVTGLNPVTGGGNSIVENALLYTPSDVIFAPWTLITVNFDHANFVHILFNMYSLFVVGPPLERFLGRARFTALFFITGIGAVVAVDFFTPEPVLGASGAIFGLLGALLILARRMGIRSGQLVLVIVLNLAIGRFVPSIAWQAHVGGLIVGLALGFVLLKTTRRTRLPLQIAALIVIPVGLVVSLLAHALA